MTSIGNDRREKKCSHSNIDGLLRFYLILIHFFFCSNLFLLLFRFCFSRFTQSILPGTLRFAFYYDVFIYGMVDVWTVIAENSIASNHQNSKFHKFHFWHCMAYNCTAWAHKRTHHIHLLMNWLLLVHAFNLIAP